MKAIISSDILYVWNIYNNEYYYKYFIIIKLFILRKQYFIVTIPRKNKYKCKCVKYI